MFTKSTSNEIIDNVLIELESYFHKFQFSYWFQSFHVKCRPIVTLQNIGGLAWISYIWPPWSKILDPPLLGIVVLSVIRSKCKLHQLSIIIQIQFSCRSNWALTDKRTQANQSFHLYAFEKPVARSAAPEISTWRFPVRFVHLLRTCCLPPHTTPQSESLHVFGISLWPASLLVIYGLAWRTSRRAIGVGDGAETKAAAPSLSYIALPSNDHLCNESINVTVYLPRHCRPNNRAGRRCELSHCWLCQRSRESHADRRLVNVSAGWIAS